MAFLSITDVPLYGKRVLIRVDFNVPMHEGKITSDARIKAALKTIRYAVKQGAQIMLASHLGRPKEGKIDNSFSLKPISDHLSKLLKTTVHLIDNLYHDNFALKNGQIVLFENTRFFTGESHCCDALSQKMAALCDVFVMEAFATAHRKAALHLQD